MAGQLTIDTLKASSGVLATQNGMTGIAKAWVNFAGASGAINGTSFNISSVTKLSTGLYTVNFTTAMPNANYSVAGSCATPTTYYGVFTPFSSSGGVPTTTTCPVATVNNAFSLTDMSYVNFVAFSS